MIPPGMKGLTAGAVQGHRCIAESGGQIPVNDSILHEVAYAGPPTRPKKWRGAMLRCEKMSTAQGDELPFKCTIFQKSRGGQGPTALVVGGRAMVGSDR